MAIYNLEFNYIDNNYIDGYIVNVYDDESKLLVYRETYGADINDIVVKNNYFKYVGDRIFVLSNKCYFDDFYNIDVYVDGSKLSNEQFSYSIKNNSITISQKVYLDMRSQIIIQYYSNLCLIKVDVSTNEPVFEVFPIYKKTHELGDHTFLV